MPVPPARPPRRASRANLIAIFLRQVFKRRGSRAVATRRSPDASTASAMFRPNRLRCGYQPDFRHKTLQSATRRFRIICIHTFSLLFPSRRQRNHRQRFGVYAWTPAACSEMLLPFVSSACCCVSCPHDASSLTMRPKHVYYRTDSIEYRNGTATFAVLWSVGEEQHYGRAQNEFAWPQPALSRQIQIWRKK